MGPPPAALVKVRTREVGSAVRALDEVENRAGALNRCDQVEAAIVEQRREFGRQALSRWAERPIPDATDTGPPATDFTFNYTLAERVGWTSVRSFALRTPSQRGLKSAAPIGADV